VEDKNASNVTKRDISLANARIRQATVDIAVIDAITARRPVITAAKVVTLRVNASRRRIVRAAVEAAVVGAMVNRNAINAEAMVTLLVNAHRAVEDVVEEAMVVDAIRTATIVASPGISHVNVRTRRVRVKTRSVATTASNLDTSVETVRRMPAEVADVTIEYIGQDTIS